MKRVLLIGLLLGCAISGFSQSMEDITSITFTKQNRGFIDEVFISRDSVQGFVENHRVPESSQQYASEIDLNAWANLMATLTGVPLDHIDGLQSPTSNRAHDGAVHSTIVITFEDGSTVSHSFDDENPHPDLRALLDAILQYRVPSGR